MSKILMALMALQFVLSAQELQLPTKQVSMHMFENSVALNAKVIQLKNEQQVASSLVEGRVKRYFVQVAQNVKKGDKIALIESIAISKMSAEYIGLKMQYKAAQKNYEATQQLYKKGIASLEKLNLVTIQKSQTEAKLKTLASQLATLGIDAKKLQKVTSKFILRAQTNGRITALLKPLNATVKRDDALVSISTNQAYYIQSYLPLAYAQKVNYGNRVVVEYAGKNIVTHVTKILPKIDAKTQRILLLSRVDTKVKNLFIGAYIKSRLYFGEARPYPAVKKSALSFFNNEWVVFVPNKGEIAYVPRVVEIMKEDAKYVAIKGLRVGEEYVSQRSYYAKSALLKSSLGDGD